MERQPRRAPGEARIFAVIPRHRRAHGVATQRQAGLTQLARIAHLRRPDRDIAQTQFVAIIERGRAAERQQQHRRDAGLCLPAPGRNARPVMVAEHPVGPTTRRQRGLIEGDRCCHGARPPWRIDELEIERQMHLGAFAAVILHQPVDRQVDLADQNPLTLSPGAIAVGDVAHLGSDQMHLGLVCRMELKQAVHFAHPGPKSRVGWIVRKILGLQHVPQHIDAEAIDAAVEPETHHIVHRRLHAGVTPVEVRLLLQEGVIVILSGGRVPLPGRAAEIADPIIRRSAIGRSVAPDVPVSLRIFSASATLDEPWMLVGAMVGHEVEQNLEPAPMGLHQQVVEVSQRTEAWIDVAIVGNVIAEINHRRRVNRRDPDGSDAKADEIIEPLRYSLEVADAVVVSVLKRARIDLIDRTTLPPGRAHASGDLACRLTVFTDHVRSSRHFHPVFRVNAGISRI